jgi:3-oxoacyl-[acyl-carrier-protein] synthase-3
MFGLDHGMRLIATGLKHVLVIGSDVKSRFTNEDDMRLLPIFADGAGAVVLSACEKGEGFLFCELWTDGTKVNNIITPRRRKCYACKYGYSEKEFTYC